MNIERNRSLGIVVIALSLLLSGVGISQAKKSKKDCKKACATTAETDKKACDKKTGKAKTMCVKEADQKLAKCKEACSK